MTLQSDGFGTFSSKARLLGSAKRQFHLFDPWLPEVQDGVPVFGIECLFRFRQQLLAKAFLHGSILPGLLTKLEDEEILNLADCQAIVRITPG